LFHHKVERAKGQAEKGGAKFKKKQEGASLRALFKKKSWNGHRDAVVAFFALRSRTRVYHIHLRRQAAFQRA